ncbi:MAG: glycosyltransferase [Cellulomonadaceae bacterium]|nr:glycosyltransferase [Cellulomonadaceae bacterium]
MKIAIVAPSPVPFGPGGAEALWAGLYQEFLTGTAHDVELLKIPVRESNLVEVMAGYEAFSRLDVSHFDLVISGKYPGWMIEHPRHVVYMLHPLRGLYDSYHHFREPFEVDSTEPVVRALMVRAASLHRAGLPAFFDLFRDAVSHLGPGHRDLRFPGPLARLLVQALDGLALAPAAVSRHMAISRTVAEREGYFPRSVTVDVVHPPSDLGGLHDEPGEYFFTASRHDGPKRLDLLVKAMAHYQGHRRLVIAGTGPETPRLRELASGDDRIEFVGRVSQAELVDHYARAVGVPFLPLDEDLGLITFEALRSGKPVLTARDSGGPTEFVRHGVNGLIVRPDPVALGEGLTELEVLAARPRTAELARGSVAGVTWPGVVRALVGSDARPVTTRGSRTGRPRLVVTSTFPIWPPRNGGQLRAYHLYGALAAWFDIDMVCLAPPDVPVSVRTLSEGVVEYVVPRSALHEAREQEVTSRVGLPVTDIVAGELYALTPEYGTLLRDRLAGADGVILADPFLHPAVAECGDVPVVYDAYNCEYVLKAQMLPATDAGRELLDRVRRVESDACGAASLIMTVSHEDRAQLHELYGAPADKFTDAPNGVDLDAISYTPMAARSRNRERWLAGLRSRGAGQGVQRIAMFIGSWHLPNLAAADAIIELAPGMPEVAFVLMGSHTGALRRRVLPPNVFALGVVHDASKVAMLAAADVALAPLTTGSGTNLKVVEYLSAGVPVVSTRVGVRGLEVPRGSVRVSELVDFPSAIREELAAAASADTRTVPARLAMQKSYDWRAIAASVRGPIEALTRAARHEPPAA